MSRLAGRVLVVLMLVGAVPDDGSAWAKRRHRRSPGPQIVNGVEDHIDLNVGVLLYNANGSRYDARLICSGTLIGCSTFLTASHCVVDDLGRPKPTQNFWVFLQYGGVFSVSAVLVPPDPSIPGEDLAVLKLAAPVVDALPPIVNTQPVGAVPAMIMGYGVTGSGGGQGILRSGQVQLDPSACIPDVACCPANQLCWQYATPIGPAGTDSNTCYGDSGGALWITPPGVVGYYLAGVTSGFYGDVSCGPGSLSFDVDVSHYLDWIQTAAGSDWAHYQCGNPPWLVYTGEGTLNATNTGDLYHYSIPAGLSHLLVTINGRDDDGSICDPLFGECIQLFPPNDFDLYVNPGTAPTTSSYRCASTTGGVFEFCDITNPEVAEWYIRVKRYSGAGPYQLTVTGLQGGCL